MDAEVVEGLLADSLMDLARTRRVGDITIGDICEHCHVSRRTFYNHFKDKHELMSWRHQRAIGRLLEEMESGLSYQALMEGCYRSFAEMSDFIRSIYMDPLASRRFIDDCVQKSTEAFTDYFRRIGADFDDEKTAFLLDYHFSANGAAMMRWLLDGMRIPIDQVAQWTLDAMPQELKALLSA